jgi:imidazolonepropionase-like amidohydrolase
MRRILSAMLLAMAIGTGGLIEAQGQTVTILAGRLLDVETGRVASSQLIRVKDGRIVAVEPFKTKPADVPFVDWSAYMVLPGLIDLHTHLVGDIQSANVASALTTSAAQDVLVGVSNARVTLRAGFTTVRDVGTFRAYADIALRDAIGRGLIEGPRMVVAGAYVTTEGGGGDVTGIAADVGIPADLRAGIVEDEASARLRARQILQHGADFIKMIGTGAVLTVGTEPGEPELTEAEMAAVAKEAARMGRYSIAHAHGAEGIKMALRAGARTIEHGSLMDDEGIALLKARGAWLVADIYNGDYIDEIGTRDGWPAETLRKNRETTDVQREVFRKAVNAGAKIGFGTDAGVFPHGQNARQFPYMVRFGMSPLQAIQSATIVAAQALRREADIGAVKPGRYADLIAIDGDPLRDIRLLMTVKGVIKGGAVIVP